MRLRLAGLMASAQRSMSFGAARERPQITAFFGALGDLVYRRPVALRGDREAGFDDVDAHGVEQFRDLELFLVGHGGAGALLAVAQCGVKDDDAVLFGLRLAWSWNWSFSLCARFRRSGVALLLQSPECPGTNAQPALRG